MTDVEASIDTEGARVCMCSDAIVEVHCHEQSVIDQPQMKAILEAENAVASGPRAVLVDIRSVRSTTREALQLTGHTMSNRDVRACVLVIDNPVSMLIGNFFIKLTRPPYPTRLFRDAAKARAWLHTHLEDVL